MLSDAALVADCLRGDPVAQRQLVERHQTDVFRLAFRMCGTAADAEDVSQEIFLRVFRYLHKWDATRPLRPWLMRVAANRCKSWLGTRGNRSVLLAEEMDPEDMRPPESDGELATEVAKAVGELRDDYRLVFTLYHDRGLDYDGIAMAVEKPVGTVKTWLHRARVELLEKLRTRGMLAGTALEAIK